MAFKEIQPAAVVPDSPEKLFLDLPRRKIPGVLPHQQELMRTYATTALQDSDVALQLPTGSGKTLVGLLIGEWRRRMYGERVVYLAPTKQLVNQVVEQAEEKYGLTVRGFTGRLKDYEPQARADYKSGTHIAVTTYSSLFNMSPFFDDADIIILDDVHAGEGYISSPWTVKVERSKKEHGALHAALSGLLKTILEPYDYTRLVGEVESFSDRAWVDKLPTPEFASIADQVAEILDAHARDTDLAYSWELIRDHLSACHLYFSTQEILIRPIIPPTWTLDAFERPKQRIYMSATLGEGGDLERLTGRPHIKRLPVPEGWDRHGVGRRFFVFPGMSLSSEETKDLRINLMKHADRSLVLVPTLRLGQEISEEVSTKLGYRVFDALDIEATKSSFTTTKPAVAVVANRYDGIDFAGSDCRLLFIEGLPRAMNLQERFLMSRMGANALFNERIQTRVLQAIGRCTRSLEDYSAVIVSGEDLPDYLADNHRREYFHPELQAELTFGIEQSKGADAASIIDNLKVFLENGEEWEKVSQQIVTLRKGVTQRPFPAMAELQESVAEEINYQKKMWQKDYESALQSADAVLALIKAPELKGYRSLWHYLAGSAAWLAAQDGGSATLNARAKQEFAKAKEGATSITWLVPLARYTGEITRGEESDDSVILGQVERLETTLASLGTTYGRKYSLREKEILEGLTSPNTSVFENAHKLLGTMLGFDAGKEETDGSPDPWWISAKKCIVFEDHSGADSTTAIDVSKARQAASHPAWMRANVPAAATADILPVLITPCVTVKKGAVPHLDEVALWRLEDFQEWAKDALATIRELRTKFTEPGDLVWRSEAVTTLKQKGFDAISLIKRLKQSKARDILKPVQ